MDISYTTDKEHKLEELQSSLQGLSHAEAKKRLERDGKNVLMGKKKQSAFVRFLAQFKDVLISVLIVSCIVSVIIGIVEKSVSEFVDAIIIFIVILFNAVIGFIHEKKSEQAMEALKNMTKPYCKVIRSERTLRIKTEELVVGDIVVLEAGDIVPADLRLLEANCLKVEESALTGESVSVEKDADVILGAETALGDRVNMAFMGTIVTYGRGVGVVVATGMNTEMGQIASALSEIKETETPLTKRIKSTSIIITLVVIIVCVIVFVVGVILGESFLSSLTMAIAIAVCAIPEGLPACNTITLSMGVRRMSEQRAIVKTLPAVETLGSTEIICSDKTGTLTLNKMTVRQIYFMGDNCDKINEFKFETNASGSVVDSVISLEDVKAQNEFASDKNFEQLIRCMLLCNDTKVRFDEEKLESIGDPTEIALVHYGYKCGFNKEHMEGTYKRVNEIPFDSNRKLMTTFHEIDGKMIAYTKGAVDNIIARCNRILDNGKIRRITQEDKEKILQKNAEFGAQALRNLAFAGKVVKKVGRPTSENTEFDLCFFGLVGMIDPPREEVKDAIKTCKQAGITTIMITGDHRDTAFAIAKELGICSEPDNVITGKELDDYSDEEFVAMVENFKVYARVSPEHKVRIVKALKAKNKIVAMTGDGVNDAPSIKAADIGIGMGVSGTDVTKETADIILTDDNFATIVGAVKEGRRIFDTIIKILMYLLGTSIAELIILTVITLVFRDNDFFSPALILWINFVSDTFVGLALGFENPEKDIMKRKPHKNTGNLFKGDVGANILCSALYETVAMITIYCVTKLVLGLSSEEITTICFLHLVFTELFHAYNLKHKTESLFSRNPFDNKLLNGAFLLSAVLTVLVVIIPLGAVDTALGVTTSLNWWQWLLGVGTGIFVIPYFEIVKWVMRRIQKRKNR